MGKVLALDVGERRIGIAEGDETLRIAHPLTTLLVDGSEIEKLSVIVRDRAPVRFVVGFPRNQAGESTRQTETVEVFAERLKVFGLPVSLQDESLTSVVAEQRLRERGKPYTKEHIDAEAATLILQDYLEAPHGH